MAEDRAPDHCSMPGEPHASFSWPLPRSGSPCQTQCRVPREETGPSTTGLFLSPCRATEASFVADTILSTQTAVNKADPNPRLCAAHSLVIS